MNIDKITLYQLLCYLDRGKPEYSETIQIVLPGNDWEQYDQISASSGLLKPFYEREITSMAVENGVLRISI